jgi:hypothetical protein
LYGERETGHIFRTTTDSLVTTRLTNTTLPAITRFIWTADDTVVLEYSGANEAPRDYIARISTTTPDQALLGHFITGVTGVLPGPDANHILETVKGDSGFRVLSAALAGGSVTQLFSSPLKSWKILTSASSTFAETAPASVAGYLYRLDGKGGMTKVVGPLNGLMALPDPTGTYVAYSDTNKLAARNVRTGATYTSPIATYAEKCAWAPGATPLLFCGVSVGGDAPSIEQWYLGLKAANDNAWLIDLSAGTATSLKELAPNANEPIDILSPAVSPNGQYAVFLNKTDLSLWSLKLYP